LKTGVFMWTWYRSSHMSIVVKLFYKRCLRECMARAAGEIVFDYFLAFSKIKDLRNKGSI
ncbi:hypothetical protein ACQP3F_32390, partial [Escherichia coli]